MQDPEFVIAFRKQRETSIGSYWTSPEHGRMVQATAGAIDDRNNGSIEIGFDYAEPYNFAQHATGLMFLRYGGLSGSDSFKRKWHKLVLCIEGPDEPPNMDAFLEPLAAALARLGPPKPGAEQLDADDAGNQPGGPPQHGVDIHPAERDPQTGKVTAGAAFRHMVMLTGIYADSPARAKLMYAVASWTAYFACAFCKLMGTMCDTVVRYLGYSKPAEVTKGHHNGCSFQMGVNDSSRMITHEGQVSRAAVERVTYEAGVAHDGLSAIKGYTPLVRCLHYVDFNRIWIVPFCHAFYLGVFKDFLNAVFAKKSTGTDQEAAGGNMPTNDILIPPGSRRTIKGRARGLELHPSFNNRYRDVMGNKASWQIEDCARAVECFFPLIFRRTRQSEVEVLQPEVVKEAYGHLRRFATFHMAVDKFDNMAVMTAAALAARKELLEYGKLAQEELSTSLCTYNLHLLCCRLTLQVLERGLTWRYGELWVERLIGEYKRRTKYRTHGCPEKTMMLDYMLRCALQQTRSASPQQLLTWKEFKVQRNQEQAPDGVLYDLEFTSSGQLLGPGKRCEGSDWPVELQGKVQKMVRDMLEQDDCEVWLTGWEFVEVYKHQRAFLSGGGYATSAAYGRSRTRDGSYVTVAYKVGEELRPYAAQVRYYLRLHLPAEVASGEALDLRVAIADFFHYREPYEDQDVCEMVLFAQDQGSRGVTYKDLDYPVLLQNIEAPLFVHRYKDADGRPWLAFAPLRFKTGGSRVQLLESVQ